jgi:hypothetical protein
MEEIENTTDLQRETRQHRTPARPATSLQAKSFEQAPAGEQADTSATSTNSDATTSKETPSLEHYESNRKRRVKIFRTTLIVILSIVALIIIGSCAAFGIYRYSAYDDAADIVGIWYVKDTDTPITITETTIVLTDDVAYKYTLDTGNKTITFNIGNLNGGGHYRFSIDRDELAIVDGDIDSWTSLTQDFCWTINALREQIFSGEEVLPAAKTDENTTLLSKTSATTQASIAATQAAQTSQAQADAQTSAQASAQSAS